MKTLYWVVLGVVLLILLYLGYRYVLDIRGDSEMKEDKEYFDVENIHDVPDDELKSKLNEKEYRVMIKEGTELPYTGELLKENRKGVFVSAGCGIPVFKSETKYKSGTGWPSFYDVIEENVVFKDDFKLGVQRTEILSKCGEHLGHVFDDGPEPTGKRYCINSAALDFVPDQDNEIDDNS